MQGICDDDVTVEQFCRRYVEPMGEESDHVHIVALTDALLVRHPLS
jgi:ubiquitin thioesterase protein OTUB1